MEIERLDEADALVVGREQADDQGVATPETRDQQAYRAEYRVTVEAAYTWDAAALELRQVWEAHETKWPSPDDAGGDGDRHLNPEANAEVERCCGRIREIAENIIVPAMRALESEDPDRHLTGLEHHLKGTDASRKRWRGCSMRAKGRSPEEAIATMKDTCGSRCLQRTALYRSYRRSRRLPTSPGSRIGQAFDRVNSWKRDQYKGINSRWRDPETGLLLRSAVSHAESASRPSSLARRLRATPQLTHTPDIERDDLQEFQRKVCCRDPHPTWRSGHRRLLPGAA